MIHICYMDGKLIITTDEVAEASELGVIYARMSAENQDVDLCHTKNEVCLKVVARYDPENDPMLEALAHARPVPNLPERDGPP